MKYNKIYIMGPPGSGKTVLAKSIAEKTRLPNFDLDDITYRETGYRKIHPTHRNRKLREILKKHDKWIIEGSYAHPWINPAVSKADLIIILNHSSVQTVIRIIFRYIKRIIGLDKAKKGAGSISDLVKLIGYARNYKEDYFIKHNALANKNKNRKVIITNKSEKNKLLNNL